MIGEEAFKGFCSQAARGVPIQALFITPTKDQLLIQQLGMIDEANARGLGTIWSAARRVLMIGPAEAALRVAHLYLDRELQGREWHFIHGLEYLDKFENGAAVQTSLKAQVRL